MITALTLYCRDKQNIHTNTYTLMCMYMLEQKHPHTSRHMHIMAMEWRRRGGISIMTQSYLSNYRRHWHWSISLLWWAASNYTYMLANTEPRVHTELQSTVSICICYCYYALTHAHVLKHTLFTCLRVHISGHQSVLLLSLVLLSFIAIMYLTLNPLLLFLLDCFYHICYHVRYVFFHYL